MSRECGLPIYPRHGEPRTLRSCGLGWGHVGQCKQLRRQPT